MTQSSSTREQRTQGANRPPTESVLSHSTYLVARNANVEDKRANQPTSEGVNDDTKRQTKRQRRNDATTQRRNDATTPSSFIFSLHSYALLRTVYSITYPRTLFVSLSPDPLDCIALCIDWMFGGVQLRGIVAMYVINRRCCDSHPDLGIF